MKDDKLIHLFPGRALRRPYTCLLALLNENQRTQLVSVVNTILFLNLSHLNVLKEQILDDLNKTSTSTRSISSISSATSNGYRNSSVAIFNCFQYRL
ncbi:unnamed protein product [Rotaria socialis]